MDGIRTFSSTQARSWRALIHGVQITGILQAVVLVLDLILIRESYAPVLLTAKARRLRKETGNWALHAAWEEKEIHAKDLAIKYGLRPLQMLATPICLFVTIYTAFIYAVFYASLAAFPIIFEQARGWNDLDAALPYLGVLLGISIGAVVNILNQQHYNAAFAANNNKPVPEARLPPMMIASVVLAAGLFLIGWTSLPDKIAPWPATAVGVLMMGFGYYTIFTSALNYLIDTFQRWGASALAANTFARSVLAAALPLCVPAMFAALGNGWGYSVLGVFACLNIPVPFLFYTFGKRIRGRGKYTANMG
jgi:hypothetical protein